MCSVHEGAGTSVGGENTPKKPPGLITKELIVWVEGVL